MNTEKRDAAQKALEQGRHEDLRALLTEEPALAQSRAEQGLSLVMLASYRQDPVALEILLAAEPDLDVHEAAAVGDLERLCVLLEEDSSRATVPAADGFQPLHLAAYFGAEQVARELVSRGAPTDEPVATPAKLRPLHSAVAGGHLGIVELLLAARVTVDARQAGDFTPLMAAAVGGWSEILERLLTAGADPSLEAEGKTAADLAREHGHADLATRLDG